MDGPAKPPSHEGEEPDARFTFANERTFLAWNRTALALIAAGLGIVHLLPPFGITGSRQIIGVPLIVLGAVIAGTSYSRWHANQRALRTGTALPDTHLPQILGGGIAVAAVLALIVTLLGGSGS